jgi:hypothetical protein
MRTRALIACIAAGLLLAGARPAAAQTLCVQVSGEVHQPGEYPMAPGSRFAEAVLAAMPTEHAYALGAAVLRPSAQAGQQRLKAGLQYDLQALASDPETTPALALRAEALREWLSTLPVTGRVRAELDPRRLEVDRASNRLLASGDQFLYPPRPATVQVVGAVTAPCTLPHVPLREAAGYLRDCPLEADSADRDQLFVIQPNGAVQRLGIALWNRAAPQALAPGAVVYVPLDERALRALPQLNDELAQFLATQTLPAATP